jgi:hypothetical protein
MVTVLEGVTTVTALFENVTDVVVLVPIAILVSTLAVPYILVLLFKFAIKISYIYVSYY